MSLWRAVTELEDLGTPYVIVTVVSVRGHAPQDPGAKALITASGLHSGTVGGGKVEARSILEAQRLLNEGAREPWLVTWNLQRDIGMTCGGEVTYLFEPHDRAAWKIVIFGAGHVAQALVRVLEPLDCQITCIDARAEWVARLPVSPKIRAIVHAEPASLVVGLDRRSFVAVMTQGHATDMPILEALFKSQLSIPYIGGIGSDVKALKIKRELEALGIPQQAIARLHCPIGLPLGGNHPHEIAISIAAELIQSRDTQNWPTRLGTNAL